MSLVSELISIFHELESVPSLSHRRVLIVWIGILFFFHHLWKRLSVQEGPCWKLLSLDEWEIRVGSLESIPEKRVGGWELWGFDHEVKLEVSLNWAQSCGGGIVSVWVVWVDGACTQASLLRAFVFWENSSSIRMREWKRIVVNVSSREARIRLLTSLLPAWMRHVGRLPSNPDLETNSDLTWAPRWGERMIGWDFQRLFPFFLLFRNLL